MPTVTETMTAPPSANMSFSERLKLGMAAGGGGAGGVPTFNRATTAATGSKMPQRSRSNSRKRNERKVGGGGGVFKMPSMPNKAIRNNEEKNNEFEKSAPVEQQKGEAAEDRLASKQDEEKENKAEIPLGETVVPDDEDDSPKHPLLHAWTLWHYQNDTKLGWDENLVPVYTFRYVEDFWGLYSRLQAASSLFSGQDYCLFKEGIRPAWEDEANMNGGRWVIGSLDPMQRGQLLDNFWLEVMMFLIGAEAQSETMVNGAVVMVRNKGDKICVWCRESRPERDVMDVGHELKKRLGIHKELNIGFEDHRAAKNKRGTKGTTFLYNV
jgi:hypothetical protein